MTAPQVRHLAAVGSSFAAGPGIYPLANRWAKRSARNYPHLLAERLGARLTDLTISGATTATILDTHQRLLWRSFPPQVTQLPADADLVTVTAAGNDLSYIGSMIRLAYAGLLTDHRLTRPLAGLLARGGVPRPSRADLERATGGLVAIVGIVRAKAPGARVLLVDYLSVLDPCTPHDRATPFDPTTRDALRRLGHQLSGVFAAASSASDAELVTVAERSRGHGAASPNPWVRGFSPSSPGSSFHPNAAGMHVVSDAIVDHLTANSRPA